MCDCDRRRRSSFGSLLTRVSTRSVWRVVPPFLFSCSSCNPPPPPIKINLVSPVRVPLNAQTRNPSAIAPNILCSQLHEPERHRTGHRHAVGPGLCWRDRRCPADRIWPQRGCPSLAAPCGLDCRQVRLVSRRFKKRRGGSVVCVCVCVCVCLCARAACADPPSPCGRNVGLYRFRRWQRPTASTFRSCDSASLR